MGSQCPDVRRRREGRHDSIHRKVLLSAPELRIMVSLHTVQCPYCGETFETTVDASAGNQDYIEDCAVCCRPIVFRLAAEGGNVQHLETRRDDD